MPPLWWSRPLVCGDSGPDVEAVQRKLGLPVTGEFDLSTVFAVRGFQKSVGLDGTGEVDAATAAALGPRATDALTPDWYPGEPLYPGFQAYDLVLGDHDEAWLRRLQGTHGLPPTGVIDEPTARLIGALQ